MRVRLILTALLGLARAAAAQQAPAPCAAAEHRQFDFWAGDWIVTDSAGATNYGTNAVTAEENGCLLHEHWAGSTGGTGQSFNFYDRAARHWTQVWVASTGTVLRLDGALEGGAMRLEGDGVSPRGPVRNRIVWTPEPDGRVRQTWSVSRDSGRTWQVGFDGWYRRRTS